MLGDKTGYFPFGGGYNTATNIVDTLIQLYKRGYLSGHDTDAYYQVSQNAGLPYTSGAIIPIIATPSDNVALNVLVNMQMKDEGVYERYAYWKPNTSESFYAEGLATHILASY